MVGADRPEPMKASPPISSSGQTNSLRFCSLSEARGDDDHGDGGRRYGTEESQPTSTIPIFSPPLRIIDGSHSTKPYTPILRCKILRAEQDHVAGAEGFAIVTHRFDALLFTIQLFLQRRFFTLRQPRTPATAYLSPAPTSRRPRSPPAPLR